MHSKAVFTDSNDFYNKNADTTDVDYISETSLTSAKGARVFAVIKFIIAVIVMIFIALGLALVLKFQSSVVPEPENNLYETFARG